MRYPATVVRSLPLFFNNLKQRSAQFWNSDGSRHARDWVATRLKQADRRIRESRLAHPSVFWAAVFSAIPLAIVIAIFVSGTAAGVWAAYHSNREDIAPLATFVTAIGVIIAAAIALMRHMAQTDADQQRRIVESFSKSVEQLGSDKLELRVGAIFALERLSRESPNDYWTIMEVLTAFVRERMRNTTVMARLSERAYFLWFQAGRPEGRSEEFWIEAVRLERLEETPTDVAAILTVIKRRSPENRQREEENEWRFDLRSTYLRGADLPGAHLEGADLGQAHLEGANLIQAHLEGARLVQAHLEGAVLIMAHLEGANLFHACLEGADLFGARLEGASLWGAHLEGANLIHARLEGANLRGARLAGANLGGARLEGADLFGARLEGAANPKLRAYTFLNLADPRGTNLGGARLEGANLGEARLEGANLGEAHLEGAILRGAVGLTDDQLLGAFGDGKTELPDGIARPKSWPPLETPT